MSNQLNKPVSDELYIQQGVKYLTRDLPTIPANFIMKNFAYLMGRYDDYNDRTSDKYIVFGVDGKWHSQTVPAMYEDVDYIKTGNYLYCLNISGIRYFGSTKAERVESLTQSFRRNFEHKYKVPNLSIVKPKELESLAKRVATIYAPNRFETKDLGLYFKKNLQDFIRNSGEVTVYISVEVAGSIQGNFADSREAYAYFKENPKEIYKYLEKSDAKITFPRY